MNILTDKSVLIVDDEPHIRMLIADEFESMGAKVSHAESGNIAFDMLEANSFDILISDLKMPNGDGLYLVRRINNELTTKPLMFLCTGYYSESLDDAKNLGIIAVFAKPFDIDVILAKVSEAMEARKSS